MDEPAIVGYGRMYIGVYKTDELKDSLVRAFKKERANQIILDDNLRGQRFRAASVAWAIDEGLLECVREKDEHGQCMVSFFSLTEKGKQVILS